METERGLITARTEARHTELEVIEEQPEKEMFAIGDNELHGNLRTIECKKLSKLSSEKRLIVKKKLEEDADSLSVDDPETLTEKATPDKYIGHLNGSHNASVETYVDNYGSNQTLAEKRTNREGISPIQLSSSIIVSQQNFNDHRQNRETIVRNLVSV